MWIPIMPRVSESKTTFGFWIPWRGLWILCTGFQKVGIRFQIPILTVGFWIPKPRVPDSTSKNFLDSGFHKQTSPRFSTCGEDYTKMQPDLRQAAVHQLTTPENTIAYHRVRGARVAQWWEHSPPTNVAPVQILASTSYVGWVCCWFSSLLREVFLRVLRFSPLLKNQHFQIPIRSGTHGHVSTSSYELLNAPWVNKLQTNQQ